MKLTRGNYVILENGEKLLYLPIELEEGKKQDILLNVEWGTYYTLSECKNQIVKIFANANATLPLWVRKPKYDITNEEYIILKSLREDYKYIARDSDDTLSVFTHYPSKGVGYGKICYWVGSEGEYFSDLEIFFKKELFTFVKSELSEPIEIQDLINNYEQKSKKK